MALVVADRVQETTTTSGTGTLSLAGAVPGYKSFVSGIGSGNTTFYAIYDQTAQVWEIGLGTVTSGAPNTLSRDTVYSNSSGTTAKINFAGNSSTVFCVYPATRSVNLDASGNVTPLGTIASGTWQGTTVGVAYGGTGVTASSGANSVVLRDANQNITVNRLNQSSTAVTAAGGTTTLTAASTFSQILNGTGGQTFKLPDATTLTNTTTFEFNNNATGTLTITDNAGATVGTVSSGGAAAIALLSNGTVGGTWDVHAYIPESVTWGTNSLALGSTVITGGTWNGGTITSAYGGTGLTTFTGANNALYSTSASALAAGTLPVAAGGTGLTATPTNGQIDIGNGTGFTRAALTQGTGMTITNGAGSITIANAGVTSLAGTSPVSASASTGSVTVSLASGYGDTQNPYASKTANYFLAAPNGIAGVPTFRAIVAADIPTLNQNTTGTAANITASSNTTLTSLANLATVGTITSGTWNASIINSTYGGTGVNNAGRTLAVNTNSGSLTFSLASTTLTVANNASVSGTNTGDQTITLTGDVTGSGTGSFATTLATVNSNVGTFGSSSAVPVVTVNAKGLVTAASTTTLSLTSGVSGTLPVANGGTGVTSSTGSGSNVLSTSPTLVTPVLGTPSSGTLSNCTVDGTNAVGYRNIPQNSQTGAYVLVAGDVGKHISITTGGVTCNASIFSAGDAVTIFNNSGSNQTITAGTNVTFRLAGTATTGNRTLAQYGVATLLCIVGGATPTFVVTGNVT